MTARRLFVFAILTLAFRLESAGLQVRAQNATADVVQRLGPRFGVDFNRGGNDLRHPTEEEVGVAPRTGYAAWLNAELARPEDAISEPPAAFRDYLRERGGDLRELMAALETASPEWGEQSNDAEWAFPRLLPTLRLERILIAVALRDEHDGDSIGARRALEASWSLGRPVIEGRYLIHQLLAVGIAKLQAGALRKIHEPSPSWLSRLSGEAAWARMLDAVEQETGPAGGPSEDPFTQGLRQLSRAVAANSRKLSPCGASRQTDDQIWRAVAGEVTAYASATPRPAAGSESAPAAEQQRVSFQDNLRNQTMAIRRAAKLAIDLELTVKILQLRLASSAAMGRAWPDHFAETSSHVCPGSSYVYRRDGDEMEIRFDGTIESAGGEPVLPLAFRGKARSRSASRGDPAGKPSPGPAANAP